MSSRMSNRIRPYNTRLSGRISGHISGSYLAAHLERLFGRCTERRVTKVDLSALTKKGVGLYFLVGILLIQNTPQGAFLIKPRGLSSLGGTYGPRAVPCGVVRATYDPRAGYVRCFTVYLRCTCGVLADYLRRFVRTLLRPFYGLRPIRIPYGTYGAPL